MHTSSCLPRLLLLAALAVGGAPRAALAQAPAAVPPPELFRATEIYTTEVARIALQHSEALKGLPRQYQAELAEAQKKLQASGDLDGMLAMAREAKRFAGALAGEGDPFERVPEMPESALVTEPAVLRAMQDAYLKRHKDSADLRAARLNDLTQRYINGLLAIQKDLTRRDRIPEAVQVRNEVERMRRMATNEQFVAQVLALLPGEAIDTGAPSAGSADDGAPPQTPTYGTTPDWARWIWERTDNYAQEGYLFAHPDLPDELQIDFNPKIGRGRISGRCFVDRRVVDMRERSWFGKGILWQIPDPQHLHATILLHAREFSANQNSGPAAHLILFADKNPLQAMTVHLMAPETTLRIVREPEAGQCALHWVQGKRTVRIDLPATGTLRLLLAVTVRNPGERCDTAITLQ